MKRFLLPLAFLLLVLSSCELIEYHPYDVSLSRKYSDLNQKSISRILAKSPTNDTIRFVRSDRTTKPLIL